MYQEARVLALLIKPVALLWRLLLRLRVSAGQLPGPERCFIYTAISRKVVEKNCARDNPER